MIAFSHFLRPHDEQWRSDAIMQGDFHPSLSTPRKSAISAMLVPIGAFAVSMVQRCMGSDTFIDRIRGRSET